MSSTKRRSTPGIRALRRNAVALAIWYAIKHRPKVDRQYAYFVLAQAFLPAEPAGSDEEQRLLAVFHEFHQDMGTTSVRAYTKWAARDADRHLPSESYLRTVLGGPKRSWK